MKGANHNINFSKDHFFEYNDTPKIGDLITLKSAPISEFYLSWYLGKERPKGWCEDRHLLESIETGELSYWHNISFAVFNREIVDKHPEWHWSDKQWQFKDKWFRTCYKKRDVYINRPEFPKFKDDGSVKLTLRKIFNHGNPTYKKFDNWKKVLVRDMLEFYDFVDSTKE